MPRGSDAAVIAKEQTQAYGSEALNAEELIRANQTAQDPALERILTMRYNDEATEEVQKNISEWADKFDLAEGEVLIDAAVHGNTVVGVIEGPDGRARKGYCGYTADWTPPKLTAEENARRVEALREQQVARETAKAQADAEARVREAEEKIARETEERIAAIRARAQEQVEAAEAEVEEGEPSATQPAPPAEPEPEQAEEPEQKGEPAEAVWPTHHAELDELAKGAPMELPSDWSDQAAWPIARKQEFLAQAGVKPSAQQ